MALIASFGYALEHTWCVAIHKDANKAVASDEGVVTTIRFVFSLKTILPNY